MKNFIIIALAFISLSSFCSKKRNKKNSTNTSKVTDTDSVKSYSKDSAIWYKVSFISIGGGIDQKAVAACKQFIADFEKNNKISSIELKIASWGREGEKDYCFALEALEDKTKKKFIEELEKILSSSTLVRYKYNCTCEKYRKVVPED
jgi:hypothetical protein